MNNPEAKEKAIQMYGEGASTYEVAAKMGIHQATVWRWCSAAGCSRSASECKGVSGTTKAKAVELYKGGKTTHEVADELGVSFASVARWCRAAGCIRETRESLFNGGSIDKKGYRVLYRHNDGSYFEHRLIAEAILARPLNQLEVVHHVNGCRSDNRPANLWVFPTDRDHHEFHQSGTIHPDMIKLIPYCGELSPCQLAT